MKINLLRHRRQCGKEAEKKGESIKQKMHTMQQEHKIEGSKSYQPITIREIKTTTNVTGTRRRTQGKTARELEGIDMSPITTLL